MAGKFFQKAATIEAPKSSTKKGAKKELFVDGLKTLAQIDHMQKALEGARKSVESEVKGNVMDLFMEEAANGKRPDSFRGIDGKKDRKSGAIVEVEASASCEMRKRSTTSALSDEEVALLAKFGLTPEKLILTQKLFGINPKYENDDALLEKASAALEKAGMPDDFIVVQEEKSRHVVNDELMDAAFAKKAPREVIETITVLATKPKVEKGSTQEIWEELRSVIAGDE